MTRALAKTGVRVIGRVSAGALQAKGMDERAIARELGVTDLLTGTVQRSAGQIRISVTLISASDGAVRWSDRYDRPLANVFAVQDEIAATVAKTLLGSLNHASGTTDKRPDTTDPEAHALFLQGQVLFNRRGARNLQQAIVLFERASARDPEYARAQASLAMSLAVLPAYVLDSTPEILSSMVAAAERAIAIDSSIPESYAALGYGYSLLGELSRAQLNFRRALSLDSTVATTWGWYGLLGGRLGEYREAQTRIMRARELEPASMIARIWEAQILYPQRRFAEAESVASSTIATGFDLHVGLDLAGQCPAGNGRDSPGSGAARTPGRDASRRSPGGSPWSARLCLCTRGPRSRSARDDREDPWEGGWAAPAGWSLAAALEELGDHEAAVALLGQAIARHDIWLVQFPRPAIRPVAKGPTSCCHVGQPDDAAIAQGASRASLASVHRARASSRICRALNSSAFNRPASRAPSAPRS